jgi:diadenosine tetraphosphate (Ap4A) HIT family hydrolase
MQTPCNFCVHLTTVELVYEDAAAAVALHEDWSVRGHAMVISKRHVENASELSADDMARFADVYRRAERAILDLTGADRAVMLKLGIVTPHLHIHIYPVSASLDRAAVMEIIEGRTREERDEEFVRALRQRLGERPSRPQ